MRAHRRDLHFRKVGQCPEPLLKANYADTQGAPFFLVACVKAGTGSRSKIDPVHYSEEDAGWAENLMPSRLIPSR
jgi:hypothetical protein